MTAVSACTASASVDTGPGSVPATCGQDSTIVGCVGASVGYSCSGTDSPDESDTALSCSVGTASNGETIYCCVDTSAVATGCSADRSIVGCTGASIGFTCSGSADPAQGNPSLVCSTGTASGGSTLYCCASYAATGSCSADTTVTGCQGNSIGFSCTSSDTPDQVNSSLVCSTGTPGNGATDYCCAPAGSTTPVVTTPTCTVDATVSCSAPASGYTCTGGIAPTASDASLSCGSGITGSDPSTLSYCCNSGTATPPASGCAANPSITTCVDGADAYSCTGGVNPMTGSTLLCDGGTAASDGSTTFCCTTN